MSIFHPLISSLMSFWDSRRNITGENRECEDVMWCDGSDFHYSLFLYSQHVPSFFIFFSLLCWLVYGWCQEASWPEHDVQIWQCMVQTPQKCCVKSRGRRCKATRWKEKRINLTQLLDKSTFWVTVSDFCPLLDVQWWTVSFLIFYSCTTFSALQ